MGTRTSGKGLSLTLRSSTGTGAVRIAARQGKSQIAFEVLDAAGDITQLRLTTDEVKVLADHLLKLVSALKRRTRTDEVTQTVIPRTGSKGG